MLANRQTEKFLNTLKDVPLMYGKKLVLAKLFGNTINPLAELRLMVTQGGVQYGLADIDYANCRHSGIYSQDVEEMTIRAMDLERKFPSAEWYLVDNVEHTIDTEYHDVSPEF